MTESYKKEAASKVPKGSQPIDPLTLPDSLTDQKAPLPLPVRGTRYAIGAILIVVILTVVTATYRRIEQQLQITLEGRLNSVLNDNAEALTGWLQDRQVLASKTAKLSVVQKLASSLASEDASRAISPEILDQKLRVLVEAGLVDEIYLLRPNGHPAWRMNADSDLSLPPKRLEQVRSSGKSVFLTRTQRDRRILSLALVGPESEAQWIWVLAIDARAMMRGLKGGSSHNNSQSYAFDRHGVLRDPHSSAAELQREKIPPGATAALEATVPLNEVKRSLDEFRGPSGDLVVSTWTWLSPFDLGIAAEIPHGEAYGSVSILRQSFLILVTLVGAALLGFIALGRWILGIREQSRQVTRRLGRLARAIQPLSAALEHEPSAVVLLDSEGTVVYANAASQDILGVSEELLGQNSGSIFENLHPELKAALISGKDSIVAQGSESDGETLLVSSRSLQIDRSTHYLYMLRPITQQVRRQEVEHWKKLIRVLSHELNNAIAPITSLLSSARTVNQMSHQDPRLGAIFESIAERTAHLVSFLEGYKAVARLPRPDPREVDWKVFLNGMESQTTFHRLGSLPTKPGYFDPIQLERVLINVLKNALEAGSRPAEIEVEIVQDENSSRINVFDRGSGMPEPVLKQAMLPFFSTKRTGTGVGLALSREIIEAHGGQLTLANREGGGLIVSCFLPLEAPPPPSRSSLG